MKKDWHHKPPTEERILEIVKTKGEFTVSWRYREDNIRKKCDSLVRRGKLQKRSKQGVDYYTLGMNI